MPVSQPFKKLLAEFRKTQRRFENEEFAVWVSPGGLHEQDLLRQPLGWTDINFVDSKDASAKAGIVWNSRYFFTLEPGGPTFSECQQAFCELADRAASLLPERAKEKLNGNSCRTAPRTFCGLHLC